MGNGNHGEALTLAESKGYRAAVYRQSTSGIGREQFMSYSGISIVGYLGHDPVADQTAKGLVSSHFSVATTERRKTAEGERKEHTSWFRVTAYGKLAEIAQSRLAKGRRVFVRGRLRLEEYTDREGKQRFSAEVTATDLLFLDAAQETGNEAETGLPAEEDPARGQVRNRHGIRRLPA